MSIIHASNVSVVSPQHKNHIHIIARRQGGCALAAFHGYFIKFKHRPTYLLVVKHDFMNSRVPSHHTEGCCKPGATLCCRLSVHSGRNQFSTLGAPLGQNLPLSQHVMKRWPINETSALYVDSVQEGSGGEAASYSSPGKANEAAMRRGWLKQAFILFFFKMSCITSLHNSTLSAGWKPRVSGVLAAFSRTRPGEWINRRWPPAKCSPAPRCSRLRREWAVANTIYAGLFHDITAVCRGERKVGEWKKAQADESQRGGRKVQSEPFGRRFNQVNQFNISTFLVIICLSPAFCLFNWLLFFSSPCFM